MAVLRIPFSPQTWPQVRDRECIVEAIRAASLEEARRGGEGKREDQQ